MDPELKEKLRKFRFRKETDNAAIISECHLPSWKDGVWGQAWGQMGGASNPHVPSLLSEGGQRPADGGVGGRISGEGMGGWDLQEGQGGTGRPKRL